MSASHRNLELSIPAGMTLIELMVVLALSSFLVIGLVQIVSAAGNSYRLQESQAEVWENARHVTAAIGRAVRQAGYSPEPWNPEFIRQGLMPESADQVLNGSDRLVLRTWSDTNCFGNLNPASDSNGQPAFYLRESLFDLASGKNFAHTCRYGPGEDGLETQINHQGLVRNVDSFQVLYGEDFSGNGRIDRWVTAGGWVDPDRVLAIRIGAVLSSSDAVIEPDRRSFHVLDHVYSARADGRLRRSFVYTVALKGSRL